MSPILALWQTWPTAHAFELPDDAAEAEREVLRVVGLWRKAAVNGLDRAIMTWSSATGIERDVCRHEVRSAIAKYRRVMPFCRRMQALHWKAAARVMEAV